MMMRFALLATVSVAALGLSAAKAADLTGAPTYKAAPLAAPIWNWTGVYLGLNAGGGIARDSTVQTITPAPTRDVLAAFTTSPAGFIGGGQAGYNYQFAPNWVAGFEADLQGANQSESTCTFVCAFTTTQRLNWLGTIRGRLGYTNGDWMYYVTGGGAWAGIKEDFAYVPFGPISGVATASSRTTSGWTVGGGVETHLMGNWTGKVEYLYVDLGSIGDTITIPGPSIVSTSSNIRDHVIRAGVNYKLY
jgi:outer membrane immunogenic protein